MVFSCTLDLYPGPDILILPMLPYPGCHEGIVHWLYWNSYTWASSDVIIILMYGHHDMSHLSVTKNFCGIFKHKMQCLMGEQDKEKESIMSVRVVGGLDRKNRHR